MLATVTSESKSSFLLLYLRFTEVLEISFVWQIIILVISWLYLQATLFVAPFFFFFSILMNTFNSFKYTLHRILCDNHT